MSITWSPLRFQTSPVEVQGHLLALETELKKQGVIIIKIKHFSMEFE